MHVAVNSKWGRLHFTDDTTPEEISELGIPRDSAEAFIELARAAKEFIRKKITEPEASRGE